MHKHTKSDPNLKFSSRGIKPCPKCREINSKTGYAFILTIWLASFWVSFN